jgi:inner membrane protein
MKKSIYLKLAGIFAVFIVMSIVLQIIGGIVKDRSSNRDEAIRSVMESSAGSQKIIGPIIVRQCTETWSEINDSKKTTQTNTRHQQFAPLKLSGANRLNVDNRKRGIFTAQVYTLQSQLVATWAASDTASMEIPSSKRGAVACSPFVAVIALSDARGIQSAAVKINGVPSAVKSSNGSLGQGIQVELDHSLFGKPLNITADLVLSGAQKIEVVPAAQESQIELSSNWPHPSFVGRTLPVERSITDKGFTATWKSTALSSTVLQDLESGKAEKARGFEVSFIDPVDHYSQSYRATNYGFLFVLLTFMAVGMIEWQNRARVHPIQYLLVGAAMVIFFLLLLSASEHIGFAKAYALGAGACVLLLAYYACSILHSFKVGTAFGASMAAMYGVLFVLLSLEQTALLVGAFALFVVLAAVMVYTRKVDWYGEGATPALGVEPQGTAQSHSHIGG